MTALDTFAAELESNLPEPLRTGLGPVAVARAPGRLDVLGGEVAFAGASVISWPTAEGCQVALRPAHDGVVELVSEGPASSDRLAFAAADLADHGESELAARLASSPRQSWAAYLVPGLLRIASSANQKVGARILVRSELPRGIGVSSSTALTVAGLAAAARAFGVEIESAAFVEMAHHVEHLVDRQLLRATTASCCSAEEGGMLPVLAQPAVAYEAAPLPPDVEAHAVHVPAETGPRGVASQKLRTAAAIAYRLVAAQMSLTVHTGERGEVQRIEDPYYEGYLANIDPVTFADQFRDSLPEELTGEQFLDQWGGVADPDVVIEPIETYPVREAALFVVSENQRACTFVEALHRAPKGERTQGEVLGAQLEQGYLAARELGLVDPRADFLITELRKRGRKRGVLGVRGSARNGPLVVLLRGGDEAHRALHESVAAFEREFGGTPTVYRGSSPGLAVRLVS